ncbi:MAG: extracellular solute-binding protein [Blautia sp.]
MRSRFISRQLDAFNEAQDKIHVTFEASPSDGYSQQLITQLAGGTAADVIFVEDTVMSQLVKNGTIANMKDFRQPMILM